MQQIKLKEEELESMRSRQGLLLKEPTRDLSGFRAAGGVRPNPYKQRDLTNVKERQNT